MQCVPLKKPDGIIRFLWENWNSIKLFTEANHERIHTIEALRKHYNADIVGGCELMVDWSQADQDFFDLFGMGEERKGAAAWNKHERNERCQPGGTSLMAFGQISPYVSKVEPDSTGLGRWVTLTLANGEKEVKVVMAYRPCFPTSIRRRGRDKLGSTVWEQHERYFRDRGEFRDPLELFDVHITDMIRQWRDNDTEVILMGDFNDNVYEGSLARILASADIRLTEQFQRLFNQDAPYSHITGTEPISAVFASPGINCEAAFISCHEAGVGDHRLHVFDFDAESLLGITAPATRRPRARNLQCRLEYARVNYERVLMQLTSRHKMFKKAKVLADGVDHMGPVEFQLAPVEFQLAFNKWDNELVELMLASEKKCRKIKNDYIPFSPIIGKWIKRLNLYRWAVKFKQGKHVNRTNLLRAFDVNNLPSPVHITLQEAQLEEHAALLMLEDMKKRAPELRVKHLQERLDIARKRDDEESATAIVRILRREYDTKKYRRLRCAFGKPKGQPASQIGVHEDDGNDNVFTSQEDVEEVGADELSSRFRNAHSAPVNSGALLDEIGTLAEKPAVEQILAGTYDFPDDWDADTRRLMEEAAAIFRHTADDVISTFVTTDDFQEWWLRADEDIQSSKSGCHFSHYKAAAHNDYLSALHCAKLNLALRTGVPLTRWGNGLTVLLEKEFGAIYIDKLRAICLFEADFNWLQKLIFAKRMMSQAIDKGIVPPEQCAKATRGLFLLNSVPKHAPIQMRAQ
jgi:hypothetical protein